MVAVITMTCVATVARVIAMTTVTGVITVPRVLVCLMPSVRLLGVLTLFGIGTAVVFVIVSVLVTVVLVWCAHRSSPSVELLFPLLSTIPPRGINSKRASLA